ncbi:MAG: sigma 54-interacting transcriptional regulator [Myxococcota bacterium]
MDRRQLLQRALDLWHVSDSGELIGGVLPLLVELTQARQAYVEVQDDRGAALWWRAQGCDDETSLREVRARTSSAIVKAAREAVDVISTVSAMLDPKLASISARNFQIEAVVCAPILRGDLPIGVVYIQNRMDGEAFESDDVDLVRALAAMLAPAVERIRRLQEADDTADVRSRFSCDELVGRSAALAAMLKRAASASPIEIDIHITGDTGTGKSTLASIIHRNSARRAGPFHSVTCGAVPRSVFEREMFGHHKGVFTSANTAVGGHVDRAIGGTLFLDEIDALNYETQSALLELLQSKTYAPVGGATRPADIRIISASNRNLAELVESKEFRKDLYYRLKSFTIRMPTLAERTEDIAVLAEHVIEAFCLRQPSLPRCTASIELLRELESREWPGNVRQLAKALEEAVVLCTGEGGQVVLPRHAFPEASMRSDMSPLTWQEATRRFQAQLLQETLERSEGNVTQAAQQLGLHRGYVHSLIRRFGLRQS